MDEVFESIKNEKEDRFAIMGGTFDPIHLGHLAAAEGIRKVYNLNRIIFMPSGDPPHKPGSCVSAAEHRYNMVCEAIISNPFFFASRMEIDREGKTYTVDTMKQIRDFLGYTIDIYFITGADSILELSTWKEPGKILSYCRLLAVTRPGYDRRELNIKIEELNHLYGSRIELVEIPTLDISSTEIRRRAAEGRNIKNLVPEPVEKYILKHNLYVSGSDDKIGKC